MYNARQAYINVNGHPMPTIRESVSDESPYDLDGKRFYINLNEITLQGYILNEDDFQVVPTISRGVIFSELENKAIKPKYSITKTNESFIYDFIFTCSDYTSTNLIITNEKKIITIESLINASNPTFTLNGNPVNLPFNVSIGDNVNIRVNRNTYQDTTFKIIGELNE